MSGRRFGGSRLFFISVILQFTQTLTEVIKIKFYFHKNKTKNWKKTGARLSIVGSYHGSSQKIRVFCSRHFRDTVRNISFPCDCTKFHENATSDLFLGSDWDEGCRVWLFSTITISMIEEHCRIYNVRQEMSLWQRVVPRWEKLPIYLTGEISSKFRGEFDFFRLSTCWLFNLFLRKTAKIIMLKKLK